MLIASLVNKPSLGYLAAAFAVFVSASAHAVFIPTPSQTDGDARASNSSAQPLTVLFNYSAQSGTYQTPVSQSGSFLAAQPGVDLTLPGPDGAALFAVDFSSATFTITALRTFIGGSFLDVAWEFTLDSAVSPPFSGATLVSSSLFSDPPFTFQIDPAVSYDATTRTISVSRFLAAGVGVATINNGGVAEIAFAVPEPSIWTLLGVGAVGMGVVSSLRQRLS